MLLVKCYRSVRIITELHISYKLTDIAQMSGQTRSISRTHHTEITIHLQRGGNVKSNKSQPEELRVVSLMGIVRGMVNFNDILSYC